MEREHANGSTKKPSHGGNLPHRPGILRLDAKYKPPSKLHHLLNATSTTIAVTLGYKREPSEKKEMNAVLIAGNFHFRFKEPGVSSKDSKPAGPDARRLLTDGHTLTKLLDICWPQDQRPPEGAAAAADIAAAQEAADAAERAAEPAPRHREVMPQEEDEAYAGGLRGNVQGNIFDEPEPTNNSAPNSESVAPEPEAGSDEDDDENDDDDYDADEADDDAMDMDSDDELDEVPDADAVGGFLTAAAVWVALSLSLAAYCQRFDDSTMEVRSKYGERTQLACRTWALAVRAHHPTVMHFYMHQGGCHTKEAYEVCGEPDQTCDTLVELGNHRAGRIKGRICWMTRAAVPEGEQWVQKRWVKARAGSGEGSGSEMPGKVMGEVRRAANASLTQQLVAAEHFAQVMRRRRPVEEDAQPLASLISGATRSHVKAEQSIKARAKRKAVLAQLGKVDEESEGEE